MTQQHRSGRQGSWEQPRQQHAAPQQNPHRRPAAPVGARGPQPVRRATQPQPFPRRQPSQPPSPTAPTGGPSILSAALPERPLRACGWSLGRRWRCREYGAQRTEGAGPPHRYRRVLPGRCASRASTRQRLGGPSARAARCGCGHRAARAGPGSAADQSPRHGNGRLSCRNVWTPTDRRVSRSQHLRRSERCCPW
jgi:hypothetical protein